MTSSTQLTIRLARPADAALLADLAALDSARPLAGDVLVAEDGGTPVAAVDLAGGRAVADPFRPTAATVAVLRLRARQLVAAPTRTRRAGARRLRLGAASG